MRKSNLFITLCTFFLSYCQEGGETRLQDFTPLGMQVLERQNFTP